MLLRVAPLLMAFVSLPLAAATISFTSGCAIPAAQAITSTIDFGAAGSPTAVDPAGHAVYATPAFNQGTDPGCGGSFLGLTGGQTTTITFDAPIDFFGFAWGTPDGYNSVQVYNGATLLATYDGSLVPTFATYYTGITAGAGEQFTRIVMSSAACCFETDSHAYHLAAATASPEPTFSFAPVVLGAAWLATRRLRRARR